MTKEEVDEIYTEMKVFQKNKEVPSKFVDELKEKLTNDNGINVEECSYLIHNSPLKMKCRSVMRLDGMHKAYGVGYKDIAVEFFME